MFKKIVIIFLGFLVVLSVIIIAFSNSGMTSKEFSLDKIAVIHIDGVIVGGRDQTSLLGEGGSTEGIIKQIRKAKEDQNVQAVILRINSPGGSAPASQEIGNEIIKLKSSGKPVVASMADIAASGGYWVAACSNKIYANPATLTGSIGVYVPYTNLEELYKKIGFKQEKIKSGPHKDILSPERNMTKEERDIVQNMVDDIYNQFLEVVATGRNMEYEKVKALADGRVFTGKQAKEAGLVDELGNMYDAIDGAAEMAGITGKFQIVEYGKTSPLAMLFGGVQEQINFREILQKQLTETPFLIAPMTVFEASGMIPVNE